MASIILPGRWQSQPQYRVKPGGSSLANGLVLAFNFSQGLVDQVSGRVAENKGTGTLSATPHGIGFLPATAGLNVPWNLNNTTGDLTIVVVESRFAYPTSDWFLCDARASSTGYIYGNTGNIFEPNTGFLTKTGTYDSWGDGFHVRSFTKTNTFQHKTSASVGTSSTTLKPLTNTRFFGRFNDVNPFVNGKILGLFLFDRNITFQEHLELVNNPWQIFRPQRRILYFNVGVASGTTLVIADANAVLQAAFAKTTNASAVLQAPFTKTAVADAVLIASASTNAVTALATAVLQAAQQKAANASAILQKTQTVTSNASGHLTGTVRLTASASAELTNTSPDNWGGDSEDWDNDDTPWDGVRYYAYTSANAKLEKAFVKAAVTSAVLQKTQAKTAGATAQLQKGFITTATANAVLQAVTGPKLAYANAVLARLDNILTANANAIIIAGGAGTLITTQANAVLNKNNLTIVGADAILTSKDWVREAAVSGSWTYDSATASSWVHDSPV